MKQIPALALSFRVISLLLAFAMLHAPLLPAASARAQSVVRRETPPARGGRTNGGEKSDSVMAGVPAPRLVAPQAVNITATKVDAFPDPDGSGQVDPGATITYTVTVTNTGTDPATGVTFTDTPDSNTTLVAGSVNTSPVVAPDAYNVVGNVRIQPNTAQGLLANDRDPDTGNSTGLTVTALAGDNSAPFAGTSAQGGQVTSSTTDGAFAYNPAPGFAGTDSFSYTVSDAGPDDIAGNADDTTDTATVTLQVGNGTATPGTNVIWFIDDTAPAGGDGRLTSPFNCYTGTSIPVTGPTCFSSTAADDSGDTIFLFDGVYTGGNALLNNQKLTGRGAGATLATLAAVTVEPYSDPLPVTGGASTVDTVTITTTLPATNAVPLAQGNLLRGFKVGNTTGAKISGTGFGTLIAGNSTALDLKLEGTGQALNLTNGTFDATSAFNGVQTTSSSAAGVSLNQIAGTVAFNGTQVTGSTTQGVFINQSTLNVNFGNTTVGGGAAGSGGTDAVSLQNNSAGARTFGALTIQNNSAVAFLHSVGGGTTTVTGATTITNPGGRGIDILSATTAVTFANTAVTQSGGTGVNLGGASSGNSGAVAFADLDISPDANQIAFSATGNTGTITTTSGTLSTTDAAALSISSSPLAMTLTSVSADNTGDTDPCVTLTGVTGALSMQGGALTGGNAAAFLVSGGSPTVTYSGSITQSSAARVVDIQGTTGNTVAFNTGTVTGGASSLGVHIGDTAAVNGNVSFSNLNLGTSGARMTNQAVTIANGTGTYSLGAVAIFTNNAQGIVATNADGTLNSTSGTVNVTGTTAVNIDGPAGLTTLGMTLTAVSSSNSPTNGIFVKDTNGGFTITGTAGTAGTGGVISSATQRGARFENATNISLSNMNFTGNGTSNLDAAGTCGDALNGANTNCAAGIDLQTVSTVSMTGVHVSGGAQQGINGKNVTALSMTNVEVNGAGNEANEDGIQFHNLLGTMSWTSVNTHDNAARQVEIQNSSSTALNLTMTDGSFTNATFQSSQTGAQGLLVAGTGSANLTVIANNSTFARNFSAAFHCDVAGSATANVTLNGGTMTDVGGFLNIGSTSSQPLTYVMNGFTTAYLDPAHTNTTPIGVLKGTGAGSLTGTISNNAFGNASIVGSAGPCSGCPTMLITNSATAATQSLSVKSNTMVHSRHGFINVTSGGSSPSLDSGFMNVSITNNNIGAADEPANNDIAIVVISGTDASDTSKTCANISGNTIGSGYANAANGGAIRLRNRFSGTQFRLPGYMGAGNDTAAVAAFISGNNGGAVATATINGNTFGGGGACAGTTAAPALSDEFASPAGTPNKVPGAASGGRVEVARLLETPSQISVPEQLSARFFSPVMLSDEINFLQVTKPVAARARPVEDTAAKPGDKSASLEKGEKSVTRGAAAPLGSPGNVSVNIGTLNPGDSVTITFQVTVDNPFPAGFTQVSNQGTVSGANFSNVLTDDPSVGGAVDPTVTLVQAPPEINVRDASTNEPATGSKNMPFTVTLNAPAASTVTVNFSTADEAPGPGKAVAGTDYTTTSGQVSFAPGQTVQTISVPVLADADAAEPDETFLVNLSAPVGGNIVGGTATGTITAANPAGTQLISELRTSGPGALGTGDPNDEFVEIYNNTDAGVTVTTADGSSGWGLYKMGAACGDTPVLVGTIPNGTVIPARGHYLFVGSGYSLAAYAAGNQTLLSGIEDDGNVALFTTATAANLATGTRLDAVGFSTNTGNNCELLSEGSTLTPAQGSISQHTFVRNQTTGVPLDRNDNATDFLALSTTPSLPVGAATAPRLGAPGPENLTSPVNRSSSIKASLADPLEPSTGPQNRVRDLTPDPANNSTFGTLAIRRKFTNQTGAPVTRLRFRVVDVTTCTTPPCSPGASAPAGVADLRVRTSSTSTIPLTGGGTTQVQGLPLETPPAQPNGGGWNSTVAAGTITPGTPLAAGASINVEFLLGVQQTGTFRFFIIVEAVLGGPPFGPGGLAPARKAGGGDMGRREPGK